MEEDILKSLEKDGTRPSELPKSKFERLSNELFNCFEIMRDVLEIEASALDKGLRAHKSTSGTDRNIFEEMDSISHIVSEISKSLLTLHQETDRDFDVSHIP